VFSETYPELWLFLMGGLFISVVMFFPNGLAGIWDKLATKYGWFKDKAEVAKKPEVSTSGVEAQGVLTETMLAADSTDAATKAPRKRASKKDTGLESSKMRGAEA